jgi:hypothetical protein
VGCGVESYGLCVHADFLASSFTTVHGRVFVTQLAGLCENVMPLTCNYWNPSLYQVFIMIIDRTGSQLDAPFKLVPGMGYRERDST